MGQRNQREGMEAMEQYNLSEREEQVARLLMEEKSNKQIALALHIAERTVEFHLKHIYEKLEVDSRVQAILKLREAAGLLGDSTVEVGDKVGRMEIDKRQPEPRNRNQSNVTRRISLAEIIRFFFTYKIPIFLWILLILIGVLVFVPLKKEAWQHEREAEYPDEVTVGQVLQRSNASNQMVHGQFGTVPAWPSRSGYARYDNIQTPQIDHLYLRLRYSKYSSSSVNILVYLDDEPDPRAAIRPVDQGDWDKFVWTDAIDLGSVKRGTHTIKFFTQGQEYGVADLDQFILTAGAPSAR